MADHAQCQHCALCIRITQHANHTRRKITGEQGRRLSRSNNWNIFRIEIEQVEVLLETNKCRQHTKTHKPLQYIVPTHHFVAVFLIDVIKENEVN